MSKGMVIYEGRGDEQYLPLSGGTMTGSTFVPTPSVDNNGKKIANTEFVNNFVSGELTKKKSNTISVTLSKDSWSGTSTPYTYDVTIRGHANMTDIVDLQMGDSMIGDQLSVAQNANIVKAEWKSNTVLRLYSYGEKPASDLPIKIIIRKL